MTWKPDYVDLALARDYLRGQDTVDDTITALDVTTASRAVDRHCHRQFGKVDAPVLRRYRAVWDRHEDRWMVDIDDLMDTTGVIVTIGGQVSTTYRLEPVNAAEDEKPWTQLILTGGPWPHGRDPEVAILAPWGWTEIPAPVKRATLVQIHRFSAARISPFGLAGAPQEGVITPRLQAKLHPDAVVALGSGYVRW